MEEPFFVSGTPGGVLGRVTADAFRWSALRYDHRLQSWQAFGLHGSPPSCACTLNADYAFGSLLVV